MKWQSAFTLRFMASSCMNVFIYVSTHACTYAFIHPFIHPVNCLSNHPFAYSSFICLPIHSFFLFIHWLSIHPSILLPIPSFMSAVHSSFLHSLICPFIHPSIHLLAHPSTPHQPIHTFICFVVLRCCRQIQGLMNTIVHEIRGSTTELQPIPMNVFL